MMEELRRPNYALAVICLIALLVCIAIPVALIYGLFALARFLGQ
jgi:hypothetical protein